MASASQKCSYGPLISYSKFLYNASIHPNIHLTTPYHAMPYHTIQYDTIPSVHTDADAHTDTYTDTYADTFADAYANAL